MFDNLKSDKVKSGLRTTRKQDRTILATYYYLDKLRDSVYDEDLEETSKLVKKLGKVERRLAKIHKKLEEFISRYDDLLGLHPRVDELIKEVEELNSKGNIFYKETVKEFSRKTGDMARILDAIKTGNDPNHWYQMGQHVRDMERSMTAWLEIEKEMTKKEVDLEADERSLVEDNELEKDLSNAETLKEIEVLDDEVYYLIEKFHAGYRERVRSTSQIKFMIKAFSRMIVRSDWLLKMLVDRGLHGLGVNVTKKLAYIPRKIAADIVSHVIFWELIGEQRYSRKVLKIASTYPSVSKRMEEFKGQGYVDAAHMLEVNGSRALSDGSVKEATKFYLALFTLLKTNSKVRGTAYISLPEGRGNYATFREAWEASIKHYPEIVRASIERMIERGGYHNLSLEEFETILSSAEVTSMPL